MRKNLDVKGLSMSQASSISNLCNQKAAEIEAELSSVNNASKKLIYNGKEYTAQQAREMPTNVIELVIEKGRLHATQAFLMENITWKDKLLKEKARERYAPNFDAPAYPELKMYQPKPLVVDAWGWENLTPKEMAEYWDVEAKASAIGKFIHKGMPLDKLRKELPDLKTMEWMTAPGTKGESYPMDVNIHHKPDELNSIHEELAKGHREFEQKVNYYKAKVKNLVADENARISKENAKEQAAVNAHNQPLLLQYQIDMKAYNDKILTETHEFEENRQKELKELAALRINVDERFQPIVDRFLVKEAEQDKE